MGITGLHNLGLPFIRYGNGDGATRKGPWDSVGPHGLPRLQRIEGRSLDAIRTTDGNVLPGEFFPHVLKDVTAVRRFQVVQDSLAHFTLKIWHGPEFVAAQEAYVRRQITKVPGNDTSISLQPLDELPWPTKGKFKV